MPITVSVPYDGTTNLIGPGSLVALSSDFIGPLPSGSYFKFVTSIDSEGSEWFWQAHYPTSAPATTFYVQSDPSVTWQTQGWQVKEGATIHVIAELHSPTAVLDSGNTTAIWSNGQIGIQQMLLQQGVVGGGLTSEQAAQLEQAATNSQSTVDSWANYETVTLPSLNDVLSGITSGITSTITGAAGAVTKTIGELFSGQLPDLIGSEELTDGATCDYWSMDLSGAPWYGLEIQITSYPDWITWTGRDSNWSEQLLYDLDVYLDGRTTYRRGVHLWTYVLAPLPQLPNDQLVLPVPRVPHNYFVEVWPTTGVCFRVYGMRFPPT